MAALQTFTRKPHAVVVPLSTQGHIYPMLQFASELISAGFIVTFIHSERFKADLLERAKDRRAGELGTNLHNDDHFHIVPVSDGMPAGKNSRPAASAFGDSIIAMERGLRTVLEESNKGEKLVTCIVADTFLAGVQDIADEFKIPKVDFCTGSATSLALILHLPLIISKGYIPTTGKKNGSTAEGRDSLITCVPGVPPLRLKDLSKEILVDDLSDPFFQILLQPCKRLRDAYCVVGNTFYELEKDCIDALRAGNISFFAVGPILPSSFLSCSGSVDMKVESDDALASAKDSTLQWLDKQSPSSVIYVSFGSFVVLPPKLLQELALGLEASQQPFVWVIRLDTPELTTSDVLPEGFCSRTAGQGLIVSWVPQISVLSHPSVGGFLTHCGWNSTMESISTGVPMLGWPFSVDQPTVMKLIVDEWKIGLELETEEGGGVRREGVERGVRKLMEGEGAKEMRKAAEKLRDAARRARSGNGSSLASFNAFVQDMKLRAQTA